MGHQANPDGGIGLGSGVAAARIVSISSMPVGMSSATVRPSAGGRSSCASLRGCHRGAWKRAGFGSRLRTRKRRYSRTWDGKTAISRSGVGAMARGIPFRSWLRVEAPLQW